MTNKSQISNLKSQNQNSKLKIFKSIYPFNPQPTTHNPQPFSGFTLLELMVVIAIIAILGGVVWGNFFSSLATGRDSRRKQDLESVARALELFYSDLKTYPNPTLGVLPTFGSPLINPTTTSVVYMPKLPQDPASGASYCYYSEDGRSYKLYGNLENTSDPKVFTTTVPCPTDSSNMYNYGISSPNTTP